MKFIGILLKEGRKEDLKKKYSTKFNEQELEFILNISDLKDFNHKYTDFVLKNTDGNKELDTDKLEYLIDLIKDFDKYQSQLTKKDVNQYVSLNDFEKVILFIRGKNKEKELEKQVDKIYEDDKFLVIKPKSEEASCKYGSNTKWCVTSKGSGYFGKYTTGRQSLYFIINKAKSTNKNYSKVAIHFDDSGTPRYWDAQDSPMGQREIEIFEYAFSDMIESIKDDYKLYADSMVDRILAQIFNSIGETSVGTSNYLNSRNDLSVYIKGFQNISDLGFGHSQAELSISLYSVDGGKLIDKYEVFITYKSEDSDSFSAIIGFMGDDKVTGDDLINLGLDDWGIDVKYNIGRNPTETAEVIRRDICSRVLSHIQNNTALIQKITGNSRVWRPNRGYGYTFSQNKGLIKKLVDYLDEGSVGTKLDFLESIGKLKSKIVDGKKYYSKNGDYLPSSNWRGYFSSFFAAAKMAGILTYRKVGTGYFLTKGPNFEAFKSGELKAI